MKRKHIIFAAGLVTGLVILSGVSALATGYKFGPLPFSAGISQPGEDSGSESKIEEVKRSIVDLLQKNMELSNLTKNEQQSIGLDPENELAISLQNGLRSVWVESLADKTFDEIVTLYKNENGQGPEFTWDSVQLEVTDWQGVVVSKGSASARFVSHFVYTSNGRSAPDQETQWEVNLTRNSTAGVWLIASRKGADLEDH